MEPSGSSASWRLDSPLIYLFGGIGAMLALIMVALIMLACSQWRSQSTATGGDDIEGGTENPLKASKHVGIAGEKSNFSPEVFVVMAGDELPSYLAAPAHVSGTHRSDGSL
ncbi:hypothetical protein LXL04_013448 [Taraxacum kok-saghyz]